MQDSITTLPDGYPISVDTETSKGHPDDGGHVAAISLAWRRPDSRGESVPSSELIRKAIPFDQGLVNLPLGPKTLNDRTTKRLSKWPDWARDEDAGNLGAYEFQFLCAHLARLSLVMANAKFDSQFLRNGLRGKPHTGTDLEDAVVWDTMLAQRVLDPAYKVGLKETAVRLSLGRKIGSIDGLEVKEGMEDDEAEALKAWLGPRTGKNADPRFDLVPWSVMRPYAGMDAVLTLVLWEMQCERFEEESGDQRISITREVDLCKVLYRMENRGIKYDVATSRRVARLVEQARVGVAEQLPFDVTPPRAKSYFFGDLGHPVFSDKLTKVKADPQLDDEVVARLATSRSWPPASAEIGPVHAKLYQQHESLKSANSKWYVAWADLVGPDGRLRTSFKQADVVSGRLAVGRVQLQAIPQPYQMPKLEGLVGVRDLFYEDLWCPDGCGSLLELWEFDLSQAEIRILAAVAQSPQLVEGFERGDDSHSMVCRLMFADLFSADGFTGREEQHPKWDELRQVAKRCNLGISYGAGSVTIQQQIKMFTGREYKLGQVKDWIEAWHDALPQMRPVLRKYERMAVDKGRIQLVNGRWRAFQVWEPHHKALNQYIQGSLAEVMKDAMILTENAIPDALLLQIHDSLVLRLRPCQLEEQKETVQKILVSTFENAFRSRWGKAPASWEEDTRRWVTVPFRSDCKRFGRKS